MPEPVGACCEALTTACEPQVACADFMHICQFGGVVAFSEHFTPKLFLSTMSMPLEAQPANTRGKIASRIFFMNLSPVDSEYCSENKRMFLLLIELRI